MNGLVATIIVLFLLMWGCVTCTSTRSYKSRTVTNTQTNIIAGAEAADGLDLQALGNLVKRVQNAEQLERELNKPNGINNLDLNEDDKVDFIKVTEYGNQKDQFGFSLTTEPVAGEEQEIAKIELIKEEQEVAVQVSGNRQIYGSGSHYGFLSTVATFGLMAYLLRPHGMYASPFGYGAYPGYYRPYSAAPYRSYRGRMDTYNRGSSVSRMSSAGLRNTTISNPNQGKTANRGITRSLKSPTATQRSFQARNPSKAARSGGFGKSGKSVRGSSGRGFGGRGK